jgi:hypothetical protein
MRKTTQIKALVYLARAAAAIALPVAIVMVFAAALGGCSASGRDGGRLAVPLLPVITWEAGGAVGEAAR